MKSSGFLAAAILAATLTQTVVAQETAIRGRVTDSTTLSPLTGVNVSYGKNGTLSLADGRFVLTGVTYASGGRSLMPAQYGTSLAPEQIDQLVAYLMTLK